MLPAAKCLKMANINFIKAAGKTISSDEMVAYWTEWVNKYPIISIEDGMAEEDWDGWKKLTDAIGNKVQLVGDDLICNQHKNFTARY